jgi:hypothetical protein
MFVAKQIDECEGEDHPGHTPSANVWNWLTCEEKAAAETICVFEAATLLCG